jgi:hemolysin-activating ACP:hemolysin acyltransferase
MMTPDVRPDTFVQPDPENPTEPQLRAYGDFSFLYLRSEFHKNIPMHMARLALQPAIDLNQFRIFRIDNVPRYGFTWAFLSPEVERKIVAGKVLTPSEWLSGKQMWVIEIIAPYGEGTAASVVHWLKRNLPKNIDSVRYMRVAADPAKNRVFDVRRINGARWGTRIAKIV